MGTGVDWRSRVADLRSRPFVAWERQWETGKIMRSLLEGQLDSAFERCTNADAPLEWKRSGAVFYDERVTLTPDNDVRIAREWSGDVRLVLFVLLALAPFFAVSARLAGVAVYTLAAVGLHGPKYRKKPIPGCTALTRIQNNGSLGLAMLVAVVLTVLITIDAVQHWMVYVIGGVALLTSLVVLYFDESLPLVRPELGKRVLLIPFNMVVPSFVSLIVFFPVVVAAGFISALGGRLASIAQEYNTRTTASVLSDMTGRTIGGANGGIDPEVVREAIFQVFPQLLQAIMAMHLLLLIMWISGSKDLYDSLVQCRLEPFRSGVQRWFAIVLFLGVHTLLLGGTAVSLGVLWYGVSGSYPLPTATLQPLTALLPAELQLAPTEFLRALFQVLDYTMASALPSLPTRPLSLVVLGVLLWPFMFVVVVTIAELLAQPYRVLRVLSHSQPLTDDEGQSLLPDDIQIRRADLGGPPNAHPMTVLFGLRKYVIVSSLILEEFEDEDLEALLRHEEYHHNERSFSLLADLLSILLGGRNTLLAFYDYRKSERKADAYAASKVGRDHLRTALYRLFQLQANSPASSDDSLIRHPGIVGPKPPTQGESEESEETTENLLKRLLASIDSYTKAPQKLYFGGALLGTAHLDEEARLSFVKDANGGLEEETEAR